MAVFDKNNFKELFRKWCMDNLSASVKEAEVYCRSLIPLHEQEKYEWLIDGSISWMIWKKQKLFKEKESFFDFELEEIS